MPPHVLLRDPYCPHRPRLQGSSGGSGGGRRRPPCRGPGLLGGHAAVCPPGHRWGPGDHLAGLHRGHVKRAHVLVAILIVPHHAASPAPSSPSSAHVAPPMHPHIVHAPTPEPPPEVARPLSFHASPHAGCPSSVATHADSFPGRRPGLGGERAVIQSGLVSEAQLLKVRRRGGVRRHPPSACAA